MVTALCDKWPDFFEVHQEIEDGPPSLIFVSVRKNSRSFQSDQLAALKWLEHIFIGTPHKVVVRVGRVDMTLDEFEKGGALGIIVSNPKPLAQSTYYAKSAEVKRLKQALETLPAESPQREPIVQRIEVLQKMMGLAEESLIDQGALQRSDQALNRLAETIGSTYTDEQLVHMTWDELAQTGIPKNTKAWSDMVTRRAKAGERLRLEQEKTQNAQQSVVVDSDLLPNEANRGNPVNEGVSQSRDGSTPSFAERHLPSPPTEGSE